MATSELPGCVIVSGMPAAGKSTVTAGPAGHNRVPVLWLCGPSGVGKTTVAWEIYTRLARAGTDVGYVDIDQLGMCFPEPDGDPGRHRVQARNLDAVVAAHRAAGARCVVVSGVVDPAHGAYPELTPHAALTVCRLRADAGELTRRLLERQGAPAVLAETLAEAEAMDANDIGDLCLDTTGRSVADTVALVEGRAAGWMGADGGYPPGGSVRHGAEGSADAAAADGPVLWLCGARGVGKSTIGFTVYMNTVSGKRIPGAYVDLGQMGFVGPAAPDDPAGHRVKARILAELWRTFRAAGAECLTVVGPAESRAAIDVYARELPAATFTVCRLHAGDAELTRRVMSRGRGGSWAEPGDPLTGLPDARLRETARAAVEQARSLDDAMVGDVRVDTDGYSAEDAADLVLARTGWPR